MRARDELQTLKRGLQALAILNMEGPANVACIAKRLDVPRANAHRIVNTLANEGYCRKVPNSHLYIVDLDSNDMLTAPCMTGVITSVAINIIEELGRRIKWPVALATHHGANMVTRVATHLSTPLALAKITPGHTQSVLDASTGITFLGMANEQVREAVLAETAEAYPALFSQWEPHFSRVFAEVRNEGYFVMRRVGAEASLGVPIILDGQPAGGIAMRYIKSATSRATVVENYLPHLQNAAEEIAEALKATSQGRRPPERAPDVDPEPEVRWARVRAQA